MASPLHSQMLRVLSCSEILAPRCRQGQHPERLPGPRDAAAAASAAAAAPPSAFSSSRSHSRFCDATLVTRGLLFLLLLLFVPSVPAASASAAAAAGAAVAAAGVNCEELGFSGLALCSDCDQLASYVKDPKLEAECRQCCLKDDSGDGTKYSAAVLEVCLRRIGLFPDVKTFLEEKAANFPLLQVKNRIGSAPKLLMKDGDGVTQETIRIDNWKTEHVENYLQEKLVRGDAEVAGSRRKAE